MGTDSAIFIAVCFKQKVCRMLSVAPKVLMLALGTSSVGLCLFFFLDFILHDIPLTLPPPI